MLHALSITYFLFGHPNNILCLVQILKLILYPPLTFTIIVHISLQFVLRHSKSMVGEDYDECEPLSQFLKSSKINVYIYEV
jgi:hypothetical protein